MARPLYSYPLLQGFAGLGPATETLDVVDGLTVVIRDINLNCRGIVGSGRVSVQLAGIELVDFVVPNQCQRRFHQEGRWVATGPTTVVLDQTAGTDFGTGYCISGYLLTT